MLTDSLTDRITPELIASVRPWASQLLSRVQSFREVWSRCDYPWRSWDAWDLKRGDTEVCDRPPPPGEAAYWATDNGLWLWFDVAAPATLAILGGAYEVVHAMQKAFDGGTPVEGIRAWQERLIVIQWLLSNPGADPTAVGLPPCPYEQPEWLGTELADDGHRLGFGEDQRDPLGLAFDMDHNAGVERDRLVGEDPLGTKSGGEGNTWLPVDSREFVQMIVRHAGGPFKRWPWIFELPDGSIQVLSTTDSSGPTLAPSAPPLEAAASRSREEVKLRATKPTAKEKQAAALVVLGGKTQTEAAEIVWGNAKKQYKVSRALSKIEAIAKGGGLPGTKEWFEAAEAPRSTTKVLVTMDPGVIEIGRRRDGRRRRPQ